MVNTLFLPELREMLADNNTFELQEFCTALHPARTAEFMEGLDAADGWNSRRRNRNRPGASEAAAGQRRGPSPG